MKLVSFNAFRTIGIPGVTYIKPDHMFKEIEVIKNADVLLFPETWQVPTLVYGLKKAIFPNVETMLLGENKIEMTRVLQAITPQHVPYTEILANTAQNIGNILETFPYPFVAKEAKNSMGQGVFLIENEAQFRTYAEQNDALYVQEFLPNDGKDLRVCVIGDQIHAAYWRVGAEGEFLHNVARGGDICNEFIPDDALDIVLSIARTLSVNHAGFDVLVSNGNYYILEFNVLFGNQGLRNEKTTVSEAIYQYILSQFVPPYPTAPTPGKIIS
ncbi:hypothetical protein MUN88_12880 [Gracilibacillus caseinilyticus]|uniref:ATP-grasp domain-containing protein n=1 Tax=Gracilibacillus caseinilyticus TaxID=2932256 RepID=A0ABY4ESY3_9BACI|nr:hypothetical protein [Gracilibacillus caseinilyticus]UOQ46983.1 hypothetical protein MUN88_12880 [Gracilibacillus caseinilyticus]